ncbi:type VII secretion-associated serine protease mycosin [Nocardia transvalensis]|uniref:type VII secretion-associated serine protease mycosin n=1 Tax=Nocardia transvalensis TaxID=37333 RepID=UPI001E3B0B8E|nr:type VII secretion-associated serine protease mycosin [Nocardia transvalensis]
MSTKSPGVPPAQAYLGLADAWKFSRGEGQKVAVIDTGVNRHPRLPNLEPGGDYVSTDDGTVDCDGHGTVVAGLIAGQPSPEDGFSGVAPAAQIMAIRQTTQYFREKGAAPKDPNNPTIGNFGDINTLASAIRHAADAGATVINISEVACGPPTLYDPSVGAAVQYAVQVKNVVVVVAAGNDDNKDCLGNTGIDPLNPAADPWDNVKAAVSPAWYDRYGLVLAVGSVDLNGQPSKFTIPGPWVGVAAPGEDIVSLDPNSSGLTNQFQGRNGQPNSLRGTSFAAPYVAGVAALVRARFPELSAQEVIERIQATAHRPPDGWNPWLGFGIVDPVAALTHQVDPNIQLVKKPTSLVNRSTQLPVPATPPPPDHTARNVALIGTGIVAVLVILGYLASFPVRRMLGVRENE